MYSDLTGRDGIFHGGAGSVLRGWGGDVDGGFPEPITECGGGGGSINISVNFATPKNVSRLCAISLEDRLTNREDGGNK